MKTMTKFSQNSLIALNHNGDPERCYYVYGLVDSRNNELFYIGKGKENRVFSHEKDAERDEKQESKKLERIREIEQSGYNVSKVILNYGLSEAEAYASEASLINAYRCKHISNNPPLVNLQSGHALDEALSVEEFEEMKGAEILEPKDFEILKNCGCSEILCVLIHNQYKVLKEKYRIVPEDEVYDIVRGCWTASLDRAKSTKLVFGVNNSNIVAVYSPTKDDWHKCSEEKYQDKIPKHNKRPVKLIANRIYFDYDYKKDSQFLVFLNKSLAKIKPYKKGQRSSFYYLNIDEILNS